MAKKSFKEQSNAAVMSFITSEPEQEQEIKTDNVSREPAEAKTSEMSTKVIKKQRINLFIDVDIFEPMNILINKDRSNLTKYINNLIRKDVESRVDDIEKAKEFFSIE